MKIEKLTENKIRVLVNFSDLNIEHLSSKNFINEALENSVLLADILKKAENEVGFNTDGCKLLIESFSSPENILVFTITKYISEMQKKKLTLKRKNLNFASLRTVFKFDDFEDFCLFCEQMNRFNLLDIKNISKNISLYLYNNTYFLIFKHIDTCSSFNKTFLSVLSEFATSLAFTTSFESKLLEHGKLIIKHNAILTGIKYFAH